MQLYTIIIIIILYHLISTELFRSVRFYRFFFYLLLSFFYLLGLEISVYHDPCVCVCVCLIIIIMNIKVYVVKLH